MPTNYTSHENHNVKRITALMSDRSEIDALKQAEHALTGVRNFNHSLLECMADGVVACDADGILTLFNCSAREWHGMDPLRLPPEEWSRHYDLFRADGITPLPTDEIPLARAFRGEIVRDAGMAIKAKGQPIRYILANGSVIHDEAGQKLGAVVIMRDVTEFGRLEQELRRTNEGLEQRVEERTEELRQSNQQLQIELAEREKIENALMLTQFSVDHAADSIMWIRPDGRFCYANEAASRLLGYSAGELLTMKTYDVNPAHPVGVWPLHWEKLQRDKTLFFEAVLLRKDGSQVPVEIHANHVVFGDQEYNCASVRDITGRKRMEDALFFIAQCGWLDGGENFFDALAQYLGETLTMDYVVIDRIDENPDIAETVALYAKGAIVPNMRYALKGTPCENVMGQRLCVYPQDVQQLFPEDRLLVEMGVESYIGIPLWDAAGKPAGLIALMNSKPLPDAASAAQLLQLVAIRAAAELARERSDQILRTREHEFRTLANSLPDNIVRYDRDGRTVYVNPVLEKTLGVASAEMIGKRVREIHPDGSYDTYAQALDATLTSGENGEFEFILPVPSEEQIVHHIRMIAERDDHGEVTGGLAIGHDITARKQAEEAVTTLNEDLEQRVVARTADLNKRGLELSESQQALMNIVEDLNQKTEELELANTKLKELELLKSMFIASMSHELRTPLNSIIGFSSILLNGWVGQVNADQKENLAIILRCGKHLLNLINDVIDVSKIEAGKIDSVSEEFDLHDLICEAVSLVSRDMEEKGLDLHVTAIRQQMQMDRRRLLQCLLNLLSNALKFTEKGGVTVEGRIVQRPGEPSAAGIAEISVTDTGIGIRGEDLPKMCQPFIRLASPLQATVPGTGLGLYLSRKLAAEVLKGDILVTSEYGKGSRFTIRIPVRIP